jgi:hypothetical protein
MKNLLWDGSRVGDLSAVWYNRNPFEQMKPNLRYQLVMKNNKTVSERVYYMRDLTDGHMREIHYTHSFALKKKMQMN